MALYKTLTSLADAVLPTEISGKLRNAIRDRRDTQNRQELERRVKYWEEHKNSGETLTVEVQEGVRLELHYDSDLCRLIYLGGYEDTERRFLNSFLREGDLFVDVGSNIGLYSMIVSKIVGARGQVYAFEPCGRTLKRLRRNVELNQCRNVSVQPVALSDRGGEMDMTVSLDGFDGWNSLAPQITGTQATVEKVRTATWDETSVSICNGRPVAMMKVDIEGWESRFLAGAKEFLSRPEAPLLQLEFNDENARSAGSSGKEVYQMLNSFGYQLFQYTGEPVLVPQPMRDEYAYVNLIATKRPREVQSRLESAAAVGWIY